jgi:hypothetical protein
VDDTVEKEVVEDVRDVTMTETAGETEMGVTSSNDLNHSTQLLQVIREDNSGTGDRVH